MRYTRIRILLDNFWALMPFLPSCEGAFGRVGIWVYPACWARMPFCHLFKGGFWTSGDLGIPRCRFAPYSRGVLEKRVFGYTQLPTQVNFHIPTQVEFVRGGIWVYPATHLNRTPYTHSGRICASGYLGIPSYPLDLRSNSCEWVFGYTQLPT